MSVVMLDDNVHINNINPFWCEPPGSKSQPYRYTPSVQNTIEQEPSELLMGANERGVEARCALDRSLYPRRMIDGGLWTLRGSEVVTPQPVMTFPVPDAMSLVLGFLVVLIIVMILRNM